MRKGGGAEGIGDMIRDDFDLVIDERELTQINGKLDLLSYTLFYKGFFMGYYHLKFILIVYSNGYLQNKWWIEKRIKSWLNNNLI